MPSTALLRNPYFPSLSFFVVRNRRTNLKFHFGTSSRARLRGHSRTHGSTAPPTEHVGFRSSREKTPWKLRCRSASAKRRLLAHAYAPILHISSLTPPSSIAILPTGRSRNRDGFCGKRGQQGRGNEPAGAALLRRRILRRHVVQNPRKNRILGVPGIRGSHRPRTWAMNAFGSSNDAFATSGTPSGSPPGRGICLDKTRQS